MHLNLLPFDHLRRELIHRRVRQWGVVWCAAIAGLLVYGWLERTDYDRLTRRLEAVNVEYAPVQQMKTEIGVLQGKLHEIQVRESIMLRLAEQRPVLTILGVIANAAKTCDGSVSATNVQLTTHAATNAKARQPTGSEQDNQVSIDGVADNDAAIARFATELRAATIFDQVSLREAADQETSGIKVRRYRIQCNY